MSRRALLALSAGLTAFVLILAGAAATYALRPAPAPVAASSAGNSVPYDVVQAREAEFRRLLDEANQRLRAQEQPFVSSPAVPAATGPVFVQQEDEDDRHEHERRHENDDEGRREHVEDDDG